MNQNKIAYSQVYSFIDSLPIENYIKIPKNVIDYINWHRDYTYKFKYDNSKTVDEQNLSKEARILILNIYLEYFADDNKKQEIMKKLSQNNIDKDTSARLKYNPDDLFKNVYEIESKSVNNQENTLIEYQENFFIKFKRFILNLIHKKRIMKMVQYLLNKIIFSQKQQSGGWIQDFT